MGGLIDMACKGCDSFIHDHDIDLSMTMTGWVDVMESDFTKRRRAGNMSSYNAVMDIRNAT